jgi:predicted class III extradiol MEMO1 family dioxygenase
MIKTGETYSTLPRIVVVSSEMHHWVDIEKSVRENPNIIKTLSSAQYCNKSGYVVRNTRMIYTAQLI